MTAIPSRTLQRIQDRAEQIHTLRSRNCRYKARWCESETNFAEKLVYRSYEFTFTHQGKEKVSTIDLHIPPSFYLCPGEARVFVIVKLCGEIIKLLKEYVESQQSDLIQLPKNPKRDDYQTLLSKLVPGSNNALTTLNSNQSKQMAEMHINRLADKEEKVHLRLCGFGLDTRRKALKKELRRKQATS